MRGTHFLILADFAQCNVMLLFRGRNLIWKKIIKKKSIICLIFFIFAFFWNPKTVITADIATNTGYKIIYNTSKRVFNFGSIRLFQDNILIKFHKKYIE